MTTCNPYDIQTIIFLIGLIAGLIFYFVTKNKVIKKIGIGSLLLILPSLIFLIFYLNKNLAFKGDYEIFKLINATLYENSASMNIEFNSWYNYTEIPPEKCFAVDSVHVRIDRGLFGMKIMTNNVKIIESNDCVHSVIDTTNLSKSHYKIGHELAKKRCFSGAIYHYTACLELDTLNNDCYYHRGLMYMAKEKYEKALVDFYVAAFIKHNKMDDNSIKFISELDIQSYVNELFSNVKGKDFENISDMTKNIIDIYDFDNYQDRIELCIKKLKE